jgi:hypothetical protein
MWDRSTREDLGLLGEGEFHGSSRSVSKRSLRVHPEACARLENAVATVVTACIHTVIAEDDEEVIFLEGVDDLS